MTKKTKKNNINLDRMTKAQLKEVLIDTRDRFDNREEEYQRLQKKMKTSDLQIKELHQELGELKRKSRTSPKEDHNLIEEYQQSEKERRTRIKNLEKEIQGLNQSKRALESKNKSLEEKIDELEQTLVIAENSETNSKKSMPAARTAFRIYFYERQDHFRGKIIHLLSKDEKTFKGVDEAAICEFITSHISEFADEKERVSPPVTSEEVINGERILGETQSTVSAPRAEVVEHIIGNIKFLQEQRVIDTGKPVSAHSPFSVQARLHLPITPTQENMDVDTSTYGIRVVAMDEAEKKVYASNGTADMLSAGVESYESEIGMPGLEPGKYRLKLYAFAPFAQILDRQDIELNVAT